MSVVESMRCDSCGKITNDFYVSKGWMEFDFATITVSKGRDSKGHGKTLYRTKNPASNSHFCNLHCFVKWLYGVHLGDFDVHIDLEDFNE